MIPSEGPPFHASGDNDRLIRRESMNVNTNLASMPAGYLFAEVARRVKQYQAENPDAPILRLGIGDVTRPLCPAAVDAMVKAAREMGTP